MSRYVRGMRGASPFGRNVVQEQAGALTNGRRVVIAASRVHFVSGVVGARTARMR